MDKFGHINKRLNLQDFFENFDKILKRTENGAYDLQSARLTGVTTPLQSSDAVNKDYVDSQKKEIDIILNAIKTELDKLNKCKK